MKLSKNRSIFLSLLFTISTLNVFAQLNFKYKAELEKVDSNGFYSISLQPSLVAKCKNDFADIKLINADNKVVPYVLSSQIPVRFQRIFIAFPQIANPLKIDTLTAYIIENRKRLSINYLYIRLRNTAVRRNVNLLGSDDLKNWYAIKENILLEDAGINKSNNYEQLLSFPASTYRYIKILINDKRKAPVNILQVGIYNQQLLMPRYNLLANAKFVQKDSGKISYVTLNLSETNLINKLHFDLYGAKFFKRNISVFNLNTKRRDLICDTSISSAGNHDIYLSTQTNKLEIRIYNEDNPPLSVQNISAYQLHQSLIGYLEANHSYYLLFGNVKESAPNYDLQSFTDSIHSRLPEVNHTAIFLNPLYKNKPANVNVFPIWVIWVAVISALLLLMTLTLKMTKEVNKKSKEA